MMQKAFYEGWVDAAQAAARAAAATGPLGRPLNQRICECFFFFFGGGVYVFIKVKP